MRNSAIKWEESAYLRIWARWIPASIMHVAFSLRIVWIVVTKSFTSSSNAVPFANFWTAWRMQSVLSKGLKVGGNADTTCTEVNYWKKWFLYVFSLNYWALNPKVLGKLCQIKDLQNTVIWPNYLIIETYGYAQKCCHNSHRNEFHVDWFSSVIFEKLLPLQRLSMIFIHFPR